MQFLDLKPGAVVLDATLGGAGHSSRIVQGIAPGGTLYALDRDTEALEAAGQRLASVRNVTIVLAHAQFSDLELVLKQKTGREGPLLDGALFDAGVSSHQLDSARGFSFLRDEALDMRMNQQSGRTAADILAEADEQELVRIIWEFGEERFARPIARAIAVYRQNNVLRTTGQLAALVQQTVPRKAWPRDIHVATRTFMALRIEVNQELDQLAQGLRAAIRMLKPGGRLVAISFHSLEDRVVKHTLAEAAGRKKPVPAHSPELFAEADRQALVQVLTAKPLQPGGEEVARNSRARSAKLRAAVKLGT